MLESIILTRYTKEAQQHYPQILLKQSFQVLESMELNNHQNEQIGNSIQYVVKKIFPVNFSLHTCNVSTHIVNRSQSAHCINPLN